MVLWYKQYGHFGILPFKLTELGQKPIFAGKMSRYSGMKYVCFYFGTMCIRPFVHSSHFRSSPKKTWIDVSPLVSRWMKSIYSYIYSQSKWTHG